MYFENGVKKTYTTNTNKIFSTVIHNLERSCSTIDIKLLIK